MQGIGMGGAMRVLLATGDEPLATAMRNAAESAGFEAGDALDGEALAAALREDDAPVDVLVLDDAMTLPTPVPDLVADRRGHGMRVLALRRFAPEPRRGRKAPRVVEGGGSAPDAQGNASPHGSPPCDGALVTPFSDAEFLAHLRVLASGDGHDSGMIIRGDLRVDTRRRQAFYGNTDVPLALSPREYEALEVLAEAGGRFLSFDDILREVRADGFFDQRDIMSHALYSLDRKLRRAGLMLTQRGDSYRIW